MRAPFAPPRLSEPRKARRRCPGSRDQFGDRQSGREDLGLQSGNVLIPDEFMIHGGNRVLPDLGLLWNQRAKVPRGWPHVAMRQLKPRLGERVGELLRMLVEAPRNRSVNRVEAQGEVSGQHGWRVALGAIVRIRHRTVARAILRCPLMRTGRALGQLPFVSRTGSGRSCCSTS